MNRNSEGNKMKKVLLATSALVLTAGVASADIALSGYASAGVTSTEGDSALGSFLRLNVNAAVETDAGIGMSVFARLVEQDGDSTTALNRTKITVTNGGLSMAVGATNGAMTAMGRQIACFGFDDGGICYHNAQAGQLSDGSNTNNVLVTMKAGDFTVGVSSNGDGSTTEFGASFVAGGVSVGVAMDNNDRWAAKLGYTLGGVALGLGTNDASDLVLTAGYDVSASTALAVAYTDKAAGQAFGLQLTQDLGAGASFIADIQESATDSTRIGAGVMFSF
jgi:outer membrane protein OmpU